MKKRGQGIQFNWVFVLIAGMVILIFFIGFTMRYRALQEKRQNVDIARGIDNILGGLKSDNLYTQTPIKLPYTFELDYNCSGIVINKDFEQDVGGKIIFSESFTGNEIIAWVKEWKSPFKVTSFIYVSSPEIEYYFIGGGADVKDEIPNVFEITSLSSTNTIIDSENVKLVFFRDVGANVRDNFPKAKIIKVEDDKIIFYEDSVEEVEYYDFETLVAGIISKDYSSYKCNLDYAFERLELMSEIYREKALLSGETRMKNKISTFIGSLSGQIDRDQFSTLKEDLVELNEAIVDGGGEAVF